METIEDVVKSLRVRAEGRRKSGKLLQIDDTMFDLLADRIEAAYKALDEDARANEAQLVTDCNQHGNAAKMREALECIDSIAKYLEAGTIRDVLHAYRNIQDRVRIALSDPARNCDVFKT